MTSWQSLYEKGYAAASNCEVDEAKLYLSQAISFAEDKNLNDELIKSLNALGVVYQNTGQIDDARACFERAINLNEKNIEVGNSYLSLGQIESSEQKYPSAIEYLNKSLDYFDGKKNRLDVLDVENSLINIVPEVVDSIETLDLETSVSGSLKEARTKGLSVLKKQESASASDIVEAIDDYIDIIQSELVSHQDDQKIQAYLKEAFDLAILWGSQLVIQFDWQWKYLSIGKHAKILTVMNPDCSQMIYPVHFVFECVQDPELDCTIKLAFSMLLEGEFSDIEDRAFENIMEMVFRVVPKEGKTRSMAASRLPNS